MNNIKTGKKSMLILTGLLLVSCLFIFKNFLFGNQILAYTDIGSDTSAQYLMHYQTIINHIQEGSFSLWDFNNGVGINMFSLNLFDPFLMLIYLLGVLLGSEQIYGLLVYMQILRILLAGLAGYGFLSCFQLSERSKIIASYLYALNGFMTVWGQHYQFGTIVITFALLLMMVEKALKNKKWHLGITIMCAVASFCSMYFGYMQFLVLGFYVLFRIAWEDKIFSKSGLKRIGCIYGSMILGIGIGMIQLLSTASMVFGVSDRMEGGSLAARIRHALIPYDKTYYVTLLKRFFSSNLQGTNTFTGYQNYYEAPNVFLTVLFLIAAVQFMYLFFKEKDRYSKKQKGLLILAGLTGIFVLAVPLGSQIFNGFAYPFSRHTFVCMPFFVLLTAWVLDRMLLEKKGSWLLLILSGIGCGGMYLRMYLAEGSKLSLLLGILAAGIVLALLGIIQNRKLLHRRYFFDGLLLFVMGTMILDSYFSYTQDRMTLEKAPSEYMEELYSESLQEALDYLEKTDDSFYRVEKDYNVGSATDCLNALAQNYAGITTYNSTLNSDTAEFFEKIWPNAILINDDHYSFANGVLDQFQASLLNVKYVISKDPDFNVSGYEFLKQFDDLYLYRNTKTEELGKFYTKVLTTETYEQNRGNLDTQAVLSDYVICDTLPELENSDFLDGQYQKEDITELTGVEQISTGGTVEISFHTLPDISEDTGISVEFDLMGHLGGRIYAEIGGRNLNLFSEEEVYHVTLNLPEGCDSLRLFDGILGENAQFSVENLKLYRYNVEDLTDLSENVSASMPEKDSLVTGTADVSENGVLMLAIPYEKGWHAFVDGKEQEIHKTDYGFCGIYLEKGEHTIQMKYECPGFLPAVYCSIFFLLLTVAIWCCIVRKEKKAGNRSS